MRGLAAHMSVASDDANMTSKQGKLLLFGSITSEVTKWVRNGRRDKIWPPNAKYSKALMAPIVNAPKIMDRQEAASKARRDGALIFIHERGANNIHAASAVASNGTVAI